MNLLETKDLDLACRQPEQVGNLTLKNTQLKEAPKEIGAMANMTHLRMEGDCIQDIPSLLDLLCKLPALRYLHLSLQACDRLPASIGALHHLEHLTFGRDQPACVACSNGSIAKAILLRTADQQLDRGRAPRQTAWELAIAEASSLQRHGESSARHGIPEASDVFLRVFHGAGADGHWRNECIGDL